MHGRRQDWTHSDKAQTYLYFPGYGPLSMKNADGSFAVAYDRRSMDLPRGASVPAGTKDIILFAPQKADALVPDADPSRVLTSFSTVKEMIASGWVIA